jgi:hypothetical protein
MFFFQLNYWLCIRAAAAVVAAALYQQQQQVTIFLAI